MAFDNQRVGLEAVILQKKRKSSLVELVAVEDLRDLKVFTDLPNQYL